MRQFRMPIQHSKNLSKFKKQIGTILRELKEFDEKEKYEAFSYLQGCISANRLKRKENKKKLKVLKTPTVKKQIFKCRGCEYKDSTKRGIFKHIQSHSGFPLSCRKCKNSYNNTLSFDWHLKFCCQIKNTKKNKYSCNECHREFYSKQNLNRHIEGHKRNNCTYCDQVITNRKHLIQHLLQIHSIKLERAIFKCGECDKRYVRKISLYYHKQQHYTDKFVCLECGKICDDSEELDSHNKKHEQQKKFKCIKCNQKFSRRQQYLMHMKRHDSYKCLTCNETFASKASMMVHKRKGHNVEGLRPKFVCPECGKEFTQKNKLLFHLKKHTDDKPTLNCQYCDKIFQSPYAYYKHSITVSHEKCSPETSVYICESCGSQFPKKYLLEQHNMRIHNNRKEFVYCEFCPYQTKNRANMNRHRETHITNGKTFICEQCGKDFNNLASLKSHLSYMHTENKQFKCDKCDKVFKRNSELLRHQGTHSDVRPHVCDICGQSYKRLTHLRRHEKSTHKIITQPRSNVKLQVEPDGSLIPAPPPPIRKEKQIDPPPVTQPESFVIPVIKFVDAEPLALVKRKDCPENSVHILNNEPSDITYFDNITTNNGNCELNQFEEEDIILDMSMMSNNVGTQYFLNTQYTNDQLIQEYIGQDNLQFVDNNTNSYVPSSNRYVLNNILGFIDSQQYDN